MNPWLILGKSYVKFLINSKILILKDCVGGECRNFAWVKWLNHKKPENNFDSDQMKSFHIELKKFKIENAASLAQESLSNAMV